MWLGNDMYVYIFQKHVYIHRETCIRNSTAAQPVTRKVMKVLFVTPWTVARQAPLSMEFSRQEYWSGPPFSSPGDLTHPGTEPWSSALQANSLPSEPPGKPKSCLNEPLTSSFLSRTVSSLALPGFDCS